VTARDIPNLITLLRIALLPLLIGLLLQQMHQQALLLFLLMGLSDGIDGWLARRYQWQSRLGALLDPIADKLLLLSCYLTAGWLAWLPWWLVALVLGRDLLIVAGAASFWRLTGELQVAPTLLSKLNTACQILLIALLLALAADHFVALLAPLQSWLLPLVALTTLASGSDYLWQWGRRAWHYRRRDGQIS